MSSDIVSTLIVIAADGSGDELLWLSIVDNHLSVFDTPAVRGCNLWCICTSSSRESQFRLARDWCLLFWQLCLIVQFQASENSAALYNSQLRLRSLNYNL